MAALAVVAIDGILLVRDAAGFPAHRRLLLYSAILIVLGASALFHAVAVAAVAGTNNNPEAGRTLAAAGFLLWVAGLALLLLAVTAGRFPAASRLAARLVEAAVAAVF